jgi:hypothetical protein
MYMANGVSGVLTSMILEMSMPWTSRFTCWMPAVIALRVIMLTPLIVYLSKSTRTSKWKFYVAIWSGLE